MDSMRRAFSLHSAALPARCSCTPNRNRLKEPTSGLVCGVHDDGLSTEHLLAVVAIAIGAAALVAAARLRPGNWTRVAGLALAALLVGAEVGWWIYLAATGATDAELGTALPLQLCDAGIFVAAFAFVLRTQLLVEMTYFWGLAGTIQAVITPDLPERFPAFPYFQYYVAHGGIVTAALFLVIGLGQWPRRDALLRVLAVTVVHTDYMFLGAWYLASRCPVSLASASEHT